MENKSHSILSFEDLCVSYQKTEILHHISANFPAGSIIGLLGPNGSGKSTLLQASARLLPASSGTILLEEKPLSSYARKELAKTLSLLPQSREIPDITVEQFVLCGRYPYYGFHGIPSTHDKEAADLAMTLTDTKVWRDRKLQRLSGGERQKVYLAMIIAQDTKLILLDEPTTYLDIQKQFEFLELLKTLNQNGKSILMALHDISHALLYSDFIAVMKQGQFIAFGTPRELYESKILEQVFQVQIHQATICKSTAYHILPISN